MMELLIEPHYLGSLEYFSLLQNYDQLKLEVSDTFLKQTFRNRAYVLGSNKVIPLIVPVIFSNRTITKDVKTDYSQRWVKDHWGAIYSAYGKAPFFEYFSEEFQTIWNEKFEYLIDLNQRMLMLCFKLLGASKEVNLTDSFNLKEIEAADFRNIVQPKVEFTHRNIYKSVSYSQLFGDRFVSNLSIIDLIMCEGPRASEILALSFRGN